MNTGGMDPAGKTELMDRSSDTNFRSYGFHNYNDAHIGSVFSDWISLTEGEKYYVEQHVENDADNGHATVGFEVQPDTPSDVMDDHPMTTAQY